MTSIDDAIREALDNLVPVVDVPDVLMELESSNDDVPDDFVPLELESLSDSSSSDSDMADQELERLSKRPMPKRKRKQKTTPQRKKNKESAQRRRDDMSRYNAFLIKNGENKETTIAAIRIKLEELADDGKDGALELLKDLNRKHPRRIIKLRL
jgi:CelD/BcsL family acetyltransferase involved in cellulose biosynthesis